MFSKKEKNTFHLRLIRFCFYLYNSCLLSFNKMKQIFLYFYICSSLLPLHPLLCNFKVTVINRLHISISFFEFRDNTSNIIYFIKLYKFIYYNGIDQTSYLSFSLHKCTFWAQFFSTWKRVNCGKISQNFPKISENFPKFLHMTILSPQI